MTALILMNTYGNVLKTLILRYSGYVCREKHSFHIYMKGCRVYI